MAAGEVHAILIEPVGVLDAGGAGGRRIDQNPWQAN
jgi:hypothetical protein